MEKRFIVSILLCSVLLLLYPHYINLISPDRPADQVSSVEVPFQEPGEPIEIVQHTGSKVLEHVAPVLNLTDEERITLSNGRLHLHISNIGASVIKAELVNARYYNEEEDHPAWLIDAASRGSYGLELSNGKIDLNQVLFQKVRDSGDGVVYRAIVNGFEIIKAYTLLDDSFSLNLEVSVRNLNETATIDAGYVFSSQFNLVGVQGIDERFVKLLTFQLGKIKKYDGGKLKKGVEHEAPEWISHQKKYFAEYIRPSYLPAKVVAGKSEDGVMFSKIVTPSLPLNPGESASHDYAIYLGPNEHNLLKDAGQGFEKSFSTGLWSLLKLSVHNLLNFIYQRVGNYGWAIIIITILFKLILLPLTNKSFKSMKTMQKLQPKMKALQEKYKEEPQKLNTETMALFKKHKANPLGGCFPMLLQMPIIIALYMSLVESVELRGAPFIFWMSDLSRPDQLFMLPFNIPLVNIHSLNVLPIAMTVTMIVQQRMMPTTVQNKDQQMIMTLMPVIFLFLFYNLPSGVVLYWFVNNLLTIVQQALLNRNETDEAIA